jgi:hypothetical protein
MLKNNNAAVDDFNKYLRINENFNRDAEVIRHWIREMGYSPHY